MNDATRSALLEFFAPDGGALAGAVRRIQEVDDAPQLDEETTSQFVNGFAVIATEALHDESTDAYDLYVEGASVAMHAQGRSVGSLASTMAIVAGILVDELVDGLDASTRTEAADWVSCFVGKFTEDTVDVMERGTA